MWYDNLIATIDIWSSKIRTLIWKFDDENESNLHILWVWVVESTSIRKWNILDMEEFKNELDKSLEEAEKMAWEQISGVYICLNSSSIEVIQSKGIVAISSEEVREDDIDRVLDMAKNGVDLPNKEILKVIPDSFVVDLEHGIKSPVWMAARKMEVIANVFSMNTNILNNIKKAIADVGIEVYDIYPGLIASPESVLTKRQKELGVVCIDIGSSTTGITVYEEGSLKYASVVPIGWDSITSDIALWLRTSIDVAEQLKITHGELSLETKEWFKDRDIDLSKISQTEDGLVSKLYLSQIITARVEELLSFINKELKFIGRDGMLPEWAVYVWWVVKTKWFLDTSKQMLRLPSIMGAPLEKDLFSDMPVNDSVFASVIGTMILANRYRWENKSISISIGWFVSSILNFVKNLAIKK